MAASKLNYVPGRFEEITGEALGSFSDSGWNYFKIGGYFKFEIGDIELRADSASGSLLVPGTDYELAKDEFYSKIEANYTGNNLYGMFRIINPAYNYKQIYVSGKNYGTMIDNEQIKKYIDDLTTGTGENPIAILNADSDLDSLLSNGKSVFISGGTTFSNTFYFNGTYTIPAGTSVYFINQQNDLTSSTLTGNTTFLFSDNGSGNIYFSSLNLGTHTLRLENNMSGGGGAGNSVQIDRLTVNNGAKILRETTGTPAAAVPVYVSKLKAVIQAPTTLTTDYVDLTYEENEGVTISSTNGVVQQELWLTPEDISKIDKTESDSLYEAMESGVITGGGLSKISATSIQVAAGTGHIIDSLSNPLSPVDTDLAWGNTTISPTVSPVLGVFYIYRDAVGAVSWDVGFPNEERRRDFIFHGFYTSENNEIKDVVSMPYKTNQLGANFNSYIYWLGLQNNIRGVAAKRVTAALSFYTTAGTGFMPRINEANPAEPSVTTIAANGNATTPATFDTYLSTGVKPSSDITIVPKRWDNAGTVTTITGNDAAIHYLYMDILGNRYLQLGNKLYDTASDARDALLTDLETFVPYPVLGEGAKLIAQIYVSASATSFDGVLADIVPPSGVPGGGGVTPPTWDAVMASGNITSRQVLIDSTGKTGTTKMFQNLVNGIANFVIFANGEMQALKGIIGNLSAGQGIFTSILKAKGIIQANTENTDAIVNIEDEEAVGVATYQFATSNTSVYEGKYSQAGTHNGFPYYTYSTYYLYRGLVTGYGWIWGTRTSLGTGDQLWAEAEFIQLEAVPDGSQNTSGTLPDEKVYDGRVSEETNAGTMTDIAVAGRPSIKAETIIAKSIGTDTSKAWEKVYEGDGTDLPAAGSRRIVLSGVSGTAFGGMVRLTAPGIQVVYGFNILQDTTGAASTRYDYTSPWVQRGEIIELSMTKDDAATAFSTQVLYGKAGNIKHFAVVPPTSGNMIVEVFAPFNIELASGTIDLTGYTQKTIDTPTSNAVYDGTLISRSELDAQVLTDGVLSGTQLNNPTLSGAVTADTAEENAALGDQGLVSYGGIKTYETVAITGASGWVVNSSDVRAYPDGSVSGRIVLNGNGTATIADGTTVATFDVSNKPFEQWVTDCYVVNSGLRTPFTVLIGTDGTIVLRLVSGITITNTDTLALTFTYRK